MEHLSMSFAAVAPTFLLIALGYLLRRVGVVQPALVPLGNGLAFSVLIPTLLFWNVYQTPSLSELPLALALYCVLGTLALYGLSMLIICLRVPHNHRRGAMVQALYRSNLVLLGLPIVDALYGDARGSAITIVIAVIVPLFNILAVITLEMFRGGRLHWSRMALGIATNPLIVGTLLGFAFVLSGLKMPGVVERAVSSLAGMATPLALLLLGADFSFASARENRAAVAVCVLGKLVAAPAIFVTLAALIGFRGIDLAIVLAVFAAPTSLSAFAMAQKMDSDARLTGEAVVLSSTVSAITLFLWVFLLKNLGLL